MKVLIMEAPGRNKDKGNWAKCKQLLEQMIKELYETKEKAQKQEEEITMLKNEVEQLKIEKFVVKKKDVDDIRKWLEFVKKKGCSKREVEDAKLDAKSINAFKGKLDRYLRHDRGLK